MTKAGDANQENKQDGREIKTTKTVFDIIEEINERKGATVGELSSSVGKAKSTVHNHVKTLKNQGYLVENEGVYDLGLKFLDHGQRAKNRPIPSNLLDPALARLADQTGEKAWAVVEEHGDAVYIGSAAGDNAVQTKFGYIGRRTSLHYTASGKAILAYLPEERVDEIIEEQELSSATGNTITNREELRQELEEIRERGVAFAEGEAVKGIRSVAAPIKPRGEILGSLAVSGPKNRLKGDRFREFIPEKLLGAANAIELEYAYA